MADVDRIEGWLLFNRTCRDSRAHEVAREWVEVVGSWQRALDWFKQGIWSPGLVRELHNRGYSLACVAKRDIPDGIRKNACKSPEHWEKFFRCL